MNLLRQAICFIFLISVLSASKAENGKSLRFSSIFPSGTQAVCSFAQDDTGLIWLGTGNGLYSYDGYRTTPYYIPSEANHPRIHAILTGKNGTLYLGTDNGLQVYHIPTNRFEENLPNSPKDIRAFLKDGNTLWTGSINGLFSYNLSNKTFRPFKALRQPVYALVKTPEGILAGTYKGLFLINHETTRELSLKKGEHPFVNSLLWDSGRHCVWVGTENGLYQYTPSNKAITPYPQFRGQTIKALTLNRNGVLWIGTDTGLHLYQSNGQVQTFVHNSQSPYSLANNIVWNLFTDRWQNLWVGTDNGVSLLEQSSYARFIPISEITGNSDGNIFHALFEDSRGYLWAGGTNGLIRTRETGNGFRETAWFKPGSTSHPLSHNRIRQIYEDREGGLWVTTDGGLNYYDYARGQFRHFLITDKSERYSCAWAYDIVEDRAGRMWVAAYMGGIFIIDRKTLLASKGTCTADTHIGNGPGRLPDIHVNRLAQDKDGNIWAFQYNNFLACINYKTLAVTPAIIPKGQRISNIIPGKDGAIWVRCEKSVLRYNSPTQPPHEYKLFENSNHTVESFCDVKGVLWAFSGQACRILDTHILNLNLNIPIGTITSACYASGKGKVLLGVNDGLWELTPGGELSRSKDIHLLQLSSIEVNGRPLALRNTGVQNLSSLKLESTENNLTFNFTDLPYKNSPSSPFLYCMEGVSSALHPFDSDDKSLSFNALPHGDYTLKIYMDDAGGQPGKLAYALDIHILPPWYLSTIAKMCYILLTIGLVVWGINFYLMRKRLKMEQIARQRITEQSQAKLTFYSNLSQQLKHPLSRLMGTLSQMMSSNKDANTRQNLEAIQDNSTQLNRLIHSALDINNNDAGEQEIFLSHLEMTGVCIRIVEKFRQEAAGKHITIRFVSNAGKLYTDIDIIKWETILNNLLSNALKYTPAGGEVAVSLDTDKKEKVYVVRVSDTGIGITYEEAPYIFQRFYQGNHPASPTKGTGLGLYIVKQYTELMHGQVVCSSTPGKGSTFTLTFPLTELPDIPASPAPAAMDANGSPGYDEQLFSKITAATEEHLSDPDFNVKKLSELTSVSEKTITRKLKQFTGLTAVEYIRSIRLKKAAMYLSQGKFTVTEVMYMVGFSNAGYFSKCFQKSFECTPKEYIRKTTLPQRPS